MTSKKHTLNPMIVTLDTLDAYDRYWLIENARREGVTVRDFILKTLKIAAEEWYATHATQEDWEAAAEGL